VEREVSPENWEIHFFAHSIYSFQFPLFIRAEELETALMEMVKQDNRRQLSAKVSHERTWFSTSLKVLITHLYGIRILVFYFYIHFFFGKFLFWDTLCFQSTTWIFQDADSGPWYTDRKFYDVYIIEVVFMWKLIRWE